MIWLLATASLGVECGEPVRPEELVAELNEAEVAYSELDDPGFRDRVNELAGVLLPCLGESLPPDIAARYHRVMSIHLYTVGDAPNALRSMTAAKTLDPTYVFPETILPDGHALNDYYLEVEPTVKVRRVAEPREGSVVFDGVNGRERPRDGPTIGQVLDSAGFASYTGYLGPREPLPPYTAIPRRRNAMIGCSAGALVVSSTFYAMAWSTRGQLLEERNNPGIRADVLEAKQAKLNLLSVASGVLGGASAGCGLGAVLVGQR